MLLCCLGFTMIAAIGNSASNISTSSIDEGAIDQTVAVIDLDGEITATAPAADFFGNTQLDMTSIIIQKLERAKKDDNVKAVLLRVNSPGGEVYASQEIYNKILDLKSADKKVVVLMKDMAASGGYFVSAPADWIIASEITITGSIGVRFSTYDFTGLYDKVGIKEIHVVNSEGNLKVLGQLDDTNSEGYKVLQQVADDTYDAFVKVVADGRGLTTDEVIKLADGRIYSGKAAKDLGLVDQLGEQDDALVKVAEIANLDDPNFIIYKDSKSGVSSLGSYVFGVFSPEKALLQKSQGRLLLYYMIEY